MVYVAICTAWVYVFEGEDPSEPGSFIFGEDFDSEAVIVKAPRNFELLKNDIENTGRDLVRMV